VLGIAEYALAVRQAQLLLDFERRVRVHGGRRCHCHHRALLVGVVGGEEGGEEKRRPATGAHRTLLNCSCLFYVDLRRVVDDRSGARVDFIGLDF
jgi:hypothetical protein